MLFGPGIKSLLAPVVSTANISTLLDSVPDFHFCSKAKGVNLDMFLITLVTKYGYICGLYCTLYPDMGTDSSNQIVKIKPMRCNIYFNLVVYCGII